MPGAGDRLGSSLSRGLAPFTADAEQAEKSLRRIAELQFDRVLFGHGGEIANPAEALRSLLGRAGGPSGSEAQI